MTTRSFWREKIQPIWRDFEWPLMGGLALLAFVIGHLGYWRQFRAMGVTPSLWDVLYYDLQLFIVQMGPVQPPLNGMLNLARFAAPAVAGYTALQALAELFAEQLQSLRLRFFQDHVVIGGLGRKGLILARGFIAQGLQVVVIEQDEQNDLIRQCGDLGAIVLIGDAADEGLLRKAGLGRARYLFALCGDDGTNAEIQINAGKLVASREGPPLTCVVQIFDAQLCDLLREREITNHWEGRLRLEFFNAFDLGARVLLEEHPLFSSSQGHPPPAVRMLVVGAGRLGESLILNAARQWRTRASAGAAKLQVTIVDARARLVADTLSVRYPSLPKCCELVPLNMDVCSPEFLQGRFLDDWPESGASTNVYVCLDDDSLSLSTALILSQKTRHLAPAIFVRMAQEAGLARLLKDASPAGGSFSSLRPFGLLDRICQHAIMLHGTHEFIARAIHEEYMRHQFARGDQPENNPSLVPWEQLAEEFKESNRQQADHLMVKLKTTGCGIAPLIDWDEPLFTFTTDEIEQLSRLEHRRRMDEKRRAGWVYGPRKDFSLKTHPCLAPYDQLAEDEKRKNINTVRQIPLFLAQVGFRVYRLPQQNSARLTA